MKHLVKIILACIFIALPVTVLSAAAEGTNTVRIWPANNSLLLVSHEIVFVIQAKLNSPMRKVSVIFDGYDVTPLLDKFARSETALIDASSLLRISIPAYTLSSYAFSSDVHTVYVEITTVSGLVISDTAVYTATESARPGGPPPFGWPCILPDTPCE